MTVNRFNAHCFSHTSKFILDSIWKERSVNQHLLLFIAHGGMHAKCFLQVCWPVFHATIVVQLLSHVRIFCDPMNCCPSGFSVHGISQTRILEWIVISSSRDLPDPGIKPTSPALAGRFFITEPSGKPFHGTINLLKSCPSKIPKHISKVIKNIITIYLDAKNICKVCQVFPLHLLTEKNFPSTFVIRKK